MADPVRIELLPIGEKFTVERGGALMDCLFAYGVEFPCGGRGRCKGCRIRMIGAPTQVSGTESQLLTAQEIGAGWRLACQAKAENDATLEIAQWEAPVLSDDSRFDFTPRDGLGVAVDLGTTTLVAQLLDLRSGRSLGVRTALNAQGRYGADIMRRIEFAVARQGQAKLTRLVRSQIGRMIGELIENVQDQQAELANVVFAGNTVMHHLFCGISLEPLSHYPFEPEYYGLQTFRASHLGWELGRNPAVRFLPCIGGFVGSDILAGVLATRLHETTELEALFDLGTNGEILVGNSERMLCASTAAGPGFEGACISQGMRAATGAISEVHVRDGRLQCHVIGGASPRGVCGSGLVDAVAAGLDLGWIEPGGKLVNKLELPLCPRGALSQRDVRELQLAKGAVAAGLRLLLERWSAAPKDLRRIHLAGAFGNYLNSANARRIGLVRSAPDRVLPDGNTALRGAKIALFHLDQIDSEIGRILNQIQHVPLNEADGFLETFVHEMRFPEPTVFR
jgi:uncharacterized 2Fe-2S/4Fe-4S cluster protein (DUF4445 family)